MLVGQHKPAPGEPDFTMFIGKFRTTTGAKPLPPLWDAERSKWIGPESPEYGAFYDDWKEAIADLEGR